MTRTTQQRRRPRLLAGLAVLVTAAATFGVVTPAQAATPTGVRAAVIGADVIRLTWAKQGASVRSYQVQVSQNTSFPSSATRTIKVNGWAATGAPTPFLNVTGLQYDKTYHLRVRACSNDGTSTCSSPSGWSSRVSGKTKYLYNTKPSNFVASNISSRSVELSFLNVSGAPGYRIRYYSKADGAKYYWSQVEELTLEGLKPNTEYWISAAVTQPALGTPPDQPNPSADYTAETRMGPFSGEMKIKTSNYSIPAPSGLRISEQTHNSVRVSWVEPATTSTSAARDLPSGEAPTGTDRPTEPAETAEPTPTPTATAGEEPSASPTASPSGEPSTQTSTSTESEQRDDSSGDTSAPASSAGVTGEDTTGGEQTGDETGTPAPAAAPAAAPQAITPSAIDVKTQAYRVQYATNKEMRSAQSKTTTSTSVVLTGLKSDTNYYVRVYVVQLDPLARVSDRSAYQIAKTRVPSVTFRGTVQGLSGDQRKDTVVTLYGDSTGDLVTQVDVNPSGGTWEAKVRPGAYRIKVNYLGKDGFTSAWLRDGAPNGTATYGQATKYWIGTVGTAKTVAPVLLQQGAVIYGKVWRATTPAKTTALNGVDVAVRTGQTSAREVEAVTDTPTTSGEDGTFRVEGLRDGVHWVRFVKPGYKDLTMWVQVEDLKATQIRFGGQTYSLWKDGAQRDINVNLARS